MKIILAGGSGQIGRALARAYSARGFEVVTLARSPTGSPCPGERFVRWDGKTPGPWAGELDGADAVINLAGRTVNCRYTKENLAQMMDSRVDSTRAIGEAVSAATRPPRLWLQMSTATIYSHRFDAPNDDENGTIGGTEPGVPDYWEFSVRIAREWERTLFAADTPDTRRIALRASMVMGPAPGGIFDTLYGLTRCRLGGPIAGGHQFVSWIHEDDFIAALDFLMAQEVSGPIIVASPNPLPQRELMRGLREAAGVRIGLPATRWMAAIGAVFMRTDVELVLKSRRVVPSRLLALGFRFRHETWSEAAHDLVRRRDEIG